MAKIPDTCEFEIVSKSEISNEKINIDDLILLSKKDSDYLINMQNIYDDIKNKINKLNNIDYDIKQKLLIHYKVDDAILFNNKKYSKIQINILNIINEVKKGNYNQLSSFNIIHFDLIFKLFEKKILIFEDYIFYLLNQVYTYDFIKILEKFIIDYKCDINIKNSQNKTLLIKSLEFNNQEIHIALIKLGCNINLSDDSGFIALYYVKNKNYKLTLNFLENYELNKKLTNYNF